MRRAFRWIMAALIALGLISAHWAIAGYEFEDTAPIIQGLLEKDL